MNIKEFLALVLSLDKTTTSFHGSIISRQEHDSLSITLWWYTATNIHNNSQQQTQGHNTTQSYNNTYKLTTTNTMPQHNTKSQQHIQMHTTCSGAVPVWFLPPLSTSSSTPVTDTRSSQNTRPGVYIVSPGLLQLTALRRVSRQHPESAVCPECRRSASHWN